MNEDSVQFPAMSGCPVCAWMIGDVPTHLCEPFDDSCHGASWLLLPSAHHMLCRAHLRELPPKFDERVCEPPYRGPKAEWRLWLYMDRLWLYVDNNGPTCMAVLRQCTKTYDE